MRTDAPVANGDPATHRWTAAQLVELYRIANPRNWEQLLRERLSALGATDPAKLTPAKLAEFKHQVLWAANRAGISDPAVLFAERAQRDATAAAAASTKLRPLVEIGDIAAQRKSAEREPVTLKNSPAATSAASQSRPAPRTAAQEAPKAKVLSRIKAAIEAGDNLHHIAEGVAFAYEHFHASQREIGRAIGRSAGWVNRLLKWRRSGYKQPGPFGPTTRLGRAAHRQRTSQPSKPHIRKEGDDDSNVTMAAHHSPPHQEPSLPTSPNESHLSEAIQTTPPPHAEAATIETEAPKTVTVAPGSAAGKTAPSDSRQVEKQKRSAENAKANQKRLQERMRIVIDALREVPTLASAAAKAGIRYKPLLYRLQCSRAGRAGYDIEYRGERWRFHEHCEDVISEAHDALEFVMWQLAMGIRYKVDPSLVELGHRGVDAYATDENGEFIVERVCRPNAKILRAYLAWKRPERWGKSPKRDISRTGGVLVVGKRPVDTTASIKARKWKSLSKLVRGSKD